jgi:hypothetical protein
VVADRQPAHAGTDGGDHSRALVAEHHRERNVPFAAHDVQGGMTHTGGGDRHLDLTNPGRQQLHIEHRRPRPYTFEHDRAYRTSTAGSHLSVSVLQTVSLGRPWNALDCDR